MEWISVKERLPKNENQDCLVSIKGHVQQYWYRYVDGKWFYLGDFNELEKSYSAQHITHWTPIEPPKID